MVDPPKRLLQTEARRKSRLKGAYIIEYVNHIEEGGEVREIICNIIVDSRSGGKNAGIKVKGVIHWVSAGDAVDIKVNEI